MITISSGFVLGLLGSLHCVGMCGPLILALPLSFKDKLLASTHLFLYNMGRVVTYTLLGLAFGILGWGVEFSGFQRMLAMGLGALLITAPFYSFLKKLPLVNKVSTLNFVKSCTQKMRSFINQKSRTSTFQLGLLNGVLPCGLVYTALASSTLLGSSLASAQYMFLFGMGTIPLMLLTMFGGHTFKRFSLRLRMVLPYLSALFGVYLIYRGYQMTVTDEPIDIVMGMTGVMCY